MIVRRAIGLVLLVAFSATAQTEQDIPDGIVQKVDPSVVAIQHERAGGSGFIVSEDGYILTNGHVVRGSDAEDPTRPAESITVILHNDQKYSAHVLGFSMDPDVALIKIEPNQTLQPVEYGDPSKAQVGQKCFAVGTPVGLKRTFTSGILSNVERADLDTSTCVFQTDAAINPGNSGGPLFDPSGRVLGLNTYGHRGANNLGFTIPIDVALVLKDHFLEHGRFIRADLPVFFASEIYEELGQTLGMMQGVLITYVMPGSAADESGLLAGDVLTAINGEAVSATTRAELLDLDWKLTTQTPGSEVTLAVVRGLPEQQQKVSLTVTMLEHEPMPKMGRHIGEIVEHRYGALGLGCKPVSRMHRLIHDLSDAEGVLVTTVKNPSPAQKAGLRINDILTHVNGRATPDLPTFQLALEEALQEQQRYIELGLASGPSTVTTALAPYYDLKDREVVMVVPDREADFLDLLQRELLAEGATLEVVYHPDHQGEETTLDTFHGKDLDILLLTGGAKGRRLWEDAELLRLVKEADEAECILAGIGPSSLALILGAPDQKDSKMTTSRDVSAEVIQREANYTGEEVESDGRIVTSTGFDRNAVRDFLNALRRASRNNS